MIGKSVPLASQKQQKKTMLTKEQYQTIYKHSLEYSDMFWTEQAKRLQWIKPFTVLKNISFNKKDLHIRWYEDGVLNVSENCIDRHLEHRGNDIAIDWKPCNKYLKKSDKSHRITFNELSSEVNRLSNGLKSLGINKGDIVTLYLPTVPEATIATLACSRIGAIHSIVLPDFSPEALAYCIEDTDCRYIITSDEGFCGEKYTKLKHNVDNAIALCSPEQINNVIILNHTDASVHRRVGRDIDYHALMSHQSNICSPEAVNSEDPLFILYTKNGNKKPVGVLHTTGGYLVHASMAHAYSFDFLPDPIYWHHSYILYGPLCNGMTVEMFEAIPNHFDTDHNQCRVIDIWWLKRTGTAALPIFGIKPTLVDPHGEELLDMAQGRLSFKDSWPGQIRTIFGDHQYFINTYFSTYKDTYFTNNDVRRDQDGYYWIT